MFKRDILALELLKTEIGKLSNNPIKSIRLFGSKARGDDKKGSDIDLFVLSKNEKQAKQILYDVSESIFMKYSANISFIIYSEERFKKCYGGGSLFLREVKREGKTIWTKN